MTTYNDAQEAFRKAIASGRLSVEKTAPNYAARFMYMNTQDGRDMFKNSFTREYLP